MHFTADAQHIKSKEALLTQNSVPYSCSAHEEKGGAYFVGSMAYRFFYVGGILETEIKISVPTPNVNIILTYPCISLLVQCIRLLVCSFIR